MNKSISESPFIFYILYYLIMKKHFCLWMISLALANTSTINAQTTVAATVVTTPDSTRVPTEVKSVTKHSVTIGGKLINYTATAGALT